VDVVRVIQAAERSLRCQGAPQRIDLADQS
jgi:hypothetical protein